MSRVGIWTDHGHLPHGSGISKYNHLTKVMIMYLNWKLLLSSTLCSISDVGIHEPQSSSQDTPYWFQFF